MMEQAALIEYAGEHSTLVWTNTDGEIHWLAFDRDGAGAELISRGRMQLPRFRWFRVSGNETYEANLEGTGPMRTYRAPVSELWQRREAGVKAKKERVHNFVEALKRVRA